MGINDHVPPRRPDFYLVSGFVVKSGEFYVKLDDGLGSVAYFDQDNATSLLSFLDESLGDGTFCEKEINDIYRNDVYLSLETDGTLIIEVTNNSPYRLVFLPRTKIKRYIVNEVKLLILELDYFLCPVNMKTLAEETSKDGV